MGEPGAQMIARAIEENLGLVLQAAESPGMNHPIPIPLVMGAPFGRIFAVLAASRLGAELRKRSKELTLPLLQLLTRARHETSAEYRTRGAASSRAAQLLARRS